MKKARDVAVLDIDNVLIDTDGYKWHMFLKVADATGLGLDETMAAYEAVKKRDGSMRMDAYITEIARGDGSLSTLIRARLQELHFSDYLQPFALVTVAALQRDRDIVFYSEGQLGDQVKKLTETGLMAIVDNQTALFIQNDQKIELTEAFAPKLPGVIIDQNKDQNVGLFIDHLGSQGRRVLYMDDKGSLVDRMAEKAHVDHPIFINFGRHAALYRPANPKVREYAKVGDMYYDISRYLLNREGSRPGMKK